MPPKLSRTQAVKKARGEEFEGGAPPEWRGEFTGVDADDDDYAAWKGEKLARAGDAWKGDDFSILQKLRHGTVREQAYGPKYSILAVNYNFDGTKLCTASEDKTARIFDRVNRKQLVKVPHADLVRCSAISNSGKLFATACDDMWARVWDLEKYHILKEPTEYLASNPIPHGNWVTWLCFSPDDKLVLSASRDRCARIFLSQPDDDDQESKIPAIKWKHKDPLCHASFSPDLQFVATASGAQRFFGVASVYSAFRGESDLGGNQLATPVTQLVHEDCVTSANFASSGKFLITCSLDGTARLWDRRFYDQAAKWQHPNWVKSAVMSPDSVYMCTACEDGYLRVYDVGMRKMLQQFEVGESLTNATWSPSGLEVATSSADGHVSVWGIEGRLSQPLQDHQAFLEAGNEPEVLTVQELPEEADPISLGIFYYRLRLQPVAK
eukprot:TRINITY_DN74082_c0_g1_i1.p1 TRINITY_DN74082_c0_g1~~TRINITY_DN74082_c0_g1_i1.p1  ORF type:complete len:438 (+),score=61.40 TRINITY_DN74082_c0_g1_i1:72-1385(+)